VIIGYNHNVTYRGSEFHVQTEDSGPQRPQLVTLLYHGGIILASKKTVYGDIANVAHLDKVVEDLAKEQHKGMLKRLISGEFDERILAQGIPLAVVAQQGAEASPSQASQPAAKPLAAPAPEPEEPRIVAEPQVDKFDQARKREPVSLKELVYAYLTAGR